MSIDIITSSQWQTQRWQNGGGITHQLCRQDDEQGMLWRLSIAEVASDGPFSRFDNIDRIIMLLTGEGFSLHGVGSKPQVLNRPLQPFHFAGETAIHCSLLNGAVRDFNLMTRRAAVQADLKVLTIDRPQHTLALNPQSIVFVASGQVSIGVNGKQFSLEQEQTLQLINEVGDVQITASEQAKLVVIRLAIQPSDQSSFRN